MGGGGSKPREIEQDNKIVNGMSINNQGLINIPPEKFQNNSIDSQDSYESIEYEFISLFNFHYAIYIILTISFFLIMFLIFISCKHPSFKKK
jgi:hypothetical protein